MTTYLDLDNADRLVSESADLLVVPDFDYEMAGARLLGRDMAASCNIETAGHIMEILVRETGKKQSYRLVEEMGGQNLFEDSGKFERALLLIENMKAGFEERIGRKG